MFNNNLLFKTYRHFKHDLPDEVSRNLKKLVPILLFAGIIELIGLLILFPVITILLDPEKLKKESFIMDVYEASGLESIMQFIILSFAILFSFFILKNFFLYIVYRKQTKIQFELASQIVNERFESYLLNDQGILKEKNIAVLLRNVTQIPYEFVSFIFIPYLNIISEILFLLLIGSLILIYNPLLVITIILFALPFLLFYNRFYKRKLQEISNIRDEKGSEQYKIAFQSMESSLEIKIFQKESYFIPQFNRVTKDFEKSMVESNVLNLFSPKLIETVAVGAIFILILVGVLVGKNLNELGSFLIVFSIGALRIVPSLNKITLSLNYMKGSFHVFDQLNNLKLSKKTDDPLHVVVENSIEFNQSIKFENIHFRHGKRTILDGLTIEIIKSEKIGIIGESGAGKSTFLSLLLLLSNPEQGEYLIDGNPVKLKHKANLYPLIGYVPQTTQLIYGTVAENIAFGIPPEQIDYDKLNRIIKQIKLESFINGLPHGLNGLLGENNQSISGGQKQRIGIARALYFERPILVLDESTSALDYQTENDIIECLISDKNLTIIFVTHRINALTKFDKTYELVSGKLIEK